MTVQPTQTLMFTYDYYPGWTLDIIARLQQSVTRQILGQETEDDGEIVSDTTEWDTHLAQYQVDGDGGGEYVLVFTRNGQVGDQIQLGAAATFFSDEFSLVEVTVDGDGGNGGDETPTPEDETPTPEDETPTPEDGTPTPEEETPTPEPGGGNGGDGGGNGGGGNGGDGGGG